MLYVDVHDERDAIATARCIFHFAFLSFCYTIA